LQERRRLDSKKGYRAAKQTTQAELPPDEYWVPQYIRAGDQDTKDPGLQGRAALELVQALEHPDPCFLGYFLGGSRRRERSKPTRRTWSSSPAAINSASLLLRSATDKHPRGLANTSDVVGRHYMGHINSVLMAISKCPNPTIFQKTLALNDFYFGSKEWEHPMGHISFVGKLDRETLRAGAPAIAPGWTLEMMAKHSLDFWLTSEDLPDLENRVTLNRSGEIVLSYTLNNEESHLRLGAKLKSLMKQQTKCDEHGHACHQGMFARNLFVGDRIPLAGVAHQNGTIRFGRDPRTSALDPNCKAHEVDNLYVVDASFFPSSGAVNPALTIMANALRVADHLQERLLA
jgi:choline dehydrogenase-like flavoprotein